VPPFDGGGWLNIRKHIMTKAAVRIKNNFIFH